MNQYRLPGRRPSLWQRAVASIVAAVMLAGLFIAGIFASIVLAGVAAVGALLLGIWAWRQRRVIAQVRKTHDAWLRQASARASQRDGDEIIEGEYEVRETDPRR